MKTFKVIVPITQRLHYIVEAENARLAQELVLNAPPNPVSQDAVPVVFAREVQVLEINEPLEDE